MNNNVVDILRAVVGELREMANSRTVIGDPVTAGDKTLVPVVTISVGFGAGGGQGTGDMTGRDTSVGTSGMAGFGGGGGAGLKVEPTAFIIMDKDGYSLLPARRGSWENVINSIPGAIEKLAKVRDSYRSQQGQSGQGGMGQGGEFTGGGEYGGPSGGQFGGGQY